VEPLRLMTRTLLIPIQELKVGPLVASNGEIVDFVKEEKIVTTAFQETVHRYYHAVPLSGSLDCPGVEGSTSALIVEHLEKKGFGVGKGQVFVDISKLNEYQKDLTFQIRRLLTRYGLFSINCKFDDVRMLDHGFTTALKIYRGKRYIQFAWWVPTLRGERKTVEGLYGWALWSEVPVTKLDAIIPQHRNVPLSSLFTSGGNTTWDEFVKNVLSIGEQ